MNLYKKNPEIKESFWLNGQEVTDETVLVGDKFEVFADPKTFPGLPPKLVKVEFAKLKKTEKVMVESMGSEGLMDPPRHLGPITSKNFQTDPSGELKIKVDPEIKKEIPIPDPVSVSNMEAPSVPRKKETAILEVYNVSGFIDDFPGVTESNVARVLKRFTTLEELANAGNADLVKVGVRTNFYSRIREAARNIIEDIEEE